MMMARLLRAAPALALLLLATIMTPTTTQAFTFSYFGSSKGSAAATSAGTGAGAAASSAGQHYHRYMVAERPVPGTDAFTKVSQGGGELSTCRAVPCRAAHVCARLPAMCSVGLHILMAWHRL